MANDKPKLAVFFASPCEAADGSFEADRAVQERCANAAIYRFTRKKSLDKITGRSLPAKQIAVFSLLSVVH